MRFTSKKNFIFDHLPKTGGTAFRTVLEEIFGRANVSPHIEDRSEMWALQRYSRFLVISGHFVSHQPGDLQGGSRAHIAVLRHPVERAISEYYYRRHHSFVGVDDRLARWAKEFDIGTFFRKRRETNETGVTNYYTKHFASRLSREMTDNETMFALAKESLGKYDFVGISEQMAVSVDLFCWRFGLPPVESVPHVNVTSSRVDMEGLDDKALTTLNEMNDLDLQLYRIALASFEQQKQQMLHELLRENWVRHRPRSVPRLLQLLRRPPSDRAPAARNATADGRQNENPGVRADGAAPASENFGNGLIKFCDTRIAGADSGTNEVAPGEKIFLTLRIVSHTDEPNLTVGMEIRDALGETVFGTNSCLRKQTISVCSHHEYEVTYSFTANLNRGRYQIGGALHTGADHLACCYHWCDKLGTFDVVQLGESDFVGYCRLEPELEWRDVTVVPRDETRDCSDPT